MDPDRAHPQAVPLRASNADREAVAQVLHAAAASGQLSLPEMEERLRHAYRATTVVDLQPLTRDLSMQPAIGPAVGAADPSVPVPQRAWAVLSSIERTGAWLVPVHYEVGALLGSARLDLRGAGFAHPHISITVYSLLGSVDIVVPEDLDVFVDGTAVLGTFDNRTERPSAPSRGSVRVSGFAVLGSVTVRPATKRERRRYQQLGG